MVATVKRTVRVKTQQRIIPELPPVENFPIRRWKIEIFLLNDEGREVPATIFDKVIYHLHPTFPNPNRTFTEPPFKIEEQGWGGFPLDISVVLMEKGGERKITHDLNFLQPEYQVDHTIHVPLNKPLLLEELKKSGSIEESSSKRKSGLNSVDLRAKKAKTSSTSTIKGTVDLEKLAFALTKLNEDDLIGVVEMINNQHTPDMNVTKNPEEGEFIIDLYSLPDDLLKNLWDYAKKAAE